MKKDYFIPEDLSSLSEEEMETYKDHPLERYEQLFVDLFIKGLIDQPSKKKSLRNYIKQIHRNICLKCNRCDNDKHFCQNMHGDCRVLSLEVELECYLEDDHYKKVDYARWWYKYKKLSKRLRRTLRNRYKWKQKALKSKQNLDLIKNLTEVMEDN